MTQNHNYNTPEQGTLDWHKPLNNNFTKLERDVPILDTEVNRSNYTPYDGSMFIATDTGRRFVGDGSSWTELPYPTETTNSTSSTADIQVSTSNGTVSATRDGSEFASGDAESVFESVIDNLADGDTVHVNPGTYTVATLKIIQGHSDVTWESEGTVVLDDDGAAQKGLLRVEDCKNVVIDGGTYDFDKDNNADDGIAGTQFVLNPRNSTGVEIKNTTVLNAFNGFVGGNNVSNVTIHDNYMKTSDERGIYHSGTAHDIEVHHNTLRDVRSGALRSNENPTGWYSHDNEIVMRDSFGPVYLFEAQCSDITIERDTAYCHGTGAIFWVNNINYHGAPQNITISDGHYEAPDNTLEFAHCEPKDGVDLSELTFANNELVNLSKVYPSVHE